VKQDRAGEPDISPSEPSQVPMKDSWLMCFRGKTSVSKNVEVNRNHLRHLWKSYIVKLIVFRRLRHLHPRLGEEVFKASNPYQLR
jgi:hypothetical protein